MLVYRFFLDVCNPNLREYLEFFRKRKLDLLYHPTKQWRILSRTEVNIYPVINLCALILHSSGCHAAPTFSLVQEPYDYPYVLFPSVAGSRSFLPTPPFSLLPARPAIVTHCHKVMARALFRYPQNFKFFHYLSITLIFSRLHVVLNVGKKITNYTV